MENIRSSDYDHLVGLSEKESNIIQRLLDMANEVWRKDHEDYPIVHELWLNW